MTAAPGRPRWRAALLALGLAALAACEGVPATGVDPAATPGLDAGPGLDPREAGAPDAFRDAAQDAAAPRADARVPDAAAEVGPADAEADAADSGRPDQGAPDPTDLGPDPAHSPLNRPLRDEVLYFVLTDRFANGDPGNDRGGPPGSLQHDGFDPRDPRRYHGGDLQGLRQGLDYLEGLGVTALWITPVFGQRALQGETAAYHGYWGVDFAAVDPHLGDAEDLDALVDEAHARGIKVMLDVVLNHTADIVRYAEGQYTYRPLSEPAYTPVVAPEWAAVKRPAWLNDVRRYNNRGNTTFEGESVVYGDFFGLDDLDTRQPEVVAGWNTLLAEWVRRHRLDGFRIDTVKHVDLDLWRSFSAAMAAAGPPWFSMFAEAWEGDPAVVSRYTVVGGIPSALDFPLQGALRGVAAGHAGPAALAGVFAHDDQYTQARSDARDLVTFTGNHDMGRIGGFLLSDRPELTRGGTRPGGDAEAVARAALAHALLFVSRGAPAVYYGDEQGFAGTGGGEPARQDVLPTGVPAWQTEPTLGGGATGAADNRDPEHPLYRALAGLAGLRAAVPALRRGHQWIRRADDAPGLWVVSRIDPDEGVEVLAAVNTGLAPLEAAVATDSPGQRFASVFAAGAGLVSPSPGVGLRADGAGAVRFSVPPLGLAVWRAEGPVAVGAVRAVDLAGPASVEAGTLRAAFEATVAGEGLACVRFERGDAAGAGGWIPLGEDCTAPYRVFADVSGLADGALRVRATARPLRGEGAVAAEVALAVDRRPVTALTLAVPPEAGLTWAQVFTDAGDALGPVALPAAEALPLPVDAGALWVLLGGPGGVAAPLALDRATLRAELDAAGRARVALSAARLGAARWPAAPPALPAPATVRGSFTGWQPGAALTPTGDGGLGATVDLPAGDHFYKFADADWSAVNLGAPVTESGLAAGGPARNLRLRQIRGGAVRLGLRGWRTPAGAVAWFPWAAADD